MIPRQNTASQVKTKNRRRLFAGLDGILGEKCGGRLKTAAIRTDDRLHTQPWPFIAAVAAGSFACGYFLPEKRKHSGC